MLYQLSKVVLIMFIAILTIFFSQRSFSYAMQTSSQPWYADSLTDLINRGILPPSSEKTFQAGKEISRGEFASLLYQSLSINDDQESNIQFSDVHKTDSQYRAIVSLAEKSILNGYEDGTFRPQNFMTRAHLAAIISKAFNYPVNKDYSLPFKDVPSNHWAIPYIGALYSADIMQGKSKTTFAPNQHVTWAQAVGILHRVLNEKEIVVPVVSYKEEIAILNVVSLSEDGRYLEITFNQPLDQIEPHQFKIYDSKSLDVRGVQGVTLKEDYSKAVLTLFPSAGLTKASDYTIEFEENGVKTTALYYQSKSYSTHNVKITAVDIKKRKITIKDEKTNKTLTLTVPNKIEFDFVAAYNREASVWYNQDDELTIYEFKNAEKDVKKKNKFIAKYNLTDFIVVKSLKESIVRGHNHELDLNDFDVIVKSHKMVKQTDIQPGDVLFYNADQKVLEICTNVVTGKIETVFGNGIDVNGKFYEYSGYFAKSNTELDYFDHFAAEKMTNEVKLFLNKDDDIVFVAH